MQWFLNQQTIYLKVHLEKSGTICGCHFEEVTGVRLLASTKQRSEILLNTLQDTGRPP
ncbi:hypothetical protein I79_010034 [Cricetulus griseus]|uniref:Uncharacterized protein n=1 Tax=Cricetulus griseus TaxID=10029 RepID=G3HHD5_CRIGR|nr:hypothetical protein I79_010034 [Cricetulus griseus]